jgi:hypothetical protein
MKITTILILPGYSSPIYCARPYIDDISKVSGSDVNLPYQDDGVNIIICH